MASITSNSSYDARTKHPYIFDKNVNIPLKNGGFVRCNLYFPGTSSPGEKFPVIATLGPYGKDVHYSFFKRDSWDELPPDHQTEHSSWETPTPSYWTAHGYVVLRADEPGSGQSPGHLNPFSEATIDAFSQVIEWASEQSWSTGKVGLLGISYFAYTQWQVAARNPKGLCAIIPWEGLTDKYRDAIRNGGILSNGIIMWVYNNTIAVNQYGLPGRAARNWGDNTLEGDLSEEELQSNRHNFLELVRSSPFRDDDLYTGMNLNLEDIHVPLLSVANWGGITLHLRGNIQGYMHASSEYKYLRFIVGRHDLPFYSPDQVEVQRSFLDAFLKGDDRMGWSRKGELPPVDLILRKGNVGFNDPKAEAHFLRRKETEWPIARTQYTPMFLLPDGGLNWAQTPGGVVRPLKAGYSAFGDVEAPSSIKFTSAAFDSEIEITGHLVLHLNVSVSPNHGGSIPTDIDLFVALRHLTNDGTEIHYTGTIGEAAPVSFGWLRVSMRKTNPQHRYHRSWLPYRDYLSTDVLPVIPNEVYDVDVEIHPTNVVVQEGERIVVEVGSKLLSGAGPERNDDEVDRYGFYT